MVTKYHFSFFIARPRKIFRLLIMTKYWYGGNVKERILNSEFVFFFLFSDGLDAYIGAANMQVSALITRNFPKHLQKSLKVLLKKSYLGQAHHMFSRFLTLRICDFFSWNFLFVFLRGRSFLMLSKMPILFTITEKDTLQPCKKTEKWNVKKNVDS